MQYRLKNILEELPPEEQRRFQRLFETGRGIHGNSAPLEEFVKEWEIVTSKDQIFLIGSNADKDKLNRLLATGWWIEQMEATSTFVLVYLKRDLPPQYHYFRSLNTTIQLWC